MNEMKEVHEQKPSGATWSEAETSGNHQQRRTMMKHSGFKLYHLLLVLVIFALTGCGASKTTTGEVGNGSLSAKLVWTQKAAAKAVASLPAGVTKLRMTVTGAGI